MVVGGGSIGASILYHLQARGLDAVLLEQNELTAGTTWHSAGMLWRLRPSDIDVQLHAYTRDMCKRLEEETEESIWTENGGLFIATNQERLSEYKRLRETGKYFGIEAHVLAPEDISSVHPLINVDGVVGAMYSPGDGTIDPTGVVNAYAKAARALGSKIYERTGVISIDCKEHGNVKTVQGVTTSSGHRIATKHVVNACGAWANQLAAMVDVKLPLLAMKHAFVVTESIPGMHAGLPNVRDHDLSIYLKTQGDSMAMGGYERNPEFWDDVDPNFAFGLFNLDWETFDENLMGHMQRCPAVETVGVKSDVCGPESFTPDHKALVGPQPGVRGFFNACGFNSMGMMMAGGIGREVATWIVEGSPTLDLFSVDCARYHRASVADGVWVKDRTHESYAKTYSIVFPHDEPLAGRAARDPGLGGVRAGSRVSALYDELVSRGCVHQARHGFERPGWFVHPSTAAVLGNGVASSSPSSPSSSSPSLADQALAAATSGDGSQAPKPYDYYGAYADEGAWRLGKTDRRAHAQTGYPAHKDHLYLSLIETELTFGRPANFAVVAEECRAARNGVALFDQSYFGKFFLEGAEAAQAVQYLCGADMSKQKLGTVTYTPLCNERGGVEADLTVTRLPDGSGYYFAAGGNTATRDFEWISRTLEARGYDARLRDASDDIVMLSVQGPHSLKLLAPLVSAADLGDLPFSHCMQACVAGKQVHVLRLTFVGELGYELHIPAKDALAVYQAIRAAGDAYEKESGFPVRDAGYRAIDSLSAEKNFRHWHADLSNSDTPLEAGIGFTVLPKLKQPRSEDTDFVGRAALERQREMGLRRKLVCVTLDDPCVLLHGAETVWRDEECVGIVRSTAFGHSLGRSVATAYATKLDHGKLTNKWLQAGVWSVGDKDQRHAATLHLAAPFDPKNTRVRGEYA